MDFLPSGIIPILAIVYFIPSIVTSVRNHRQLGAIFRLNIFLGWTFVGWAAALIWAMDRDETKSTDAANRSPTCAAPIMDCFSEGSEPTGLTASPVPAARTAIAIAARDSILIAIVPPFVRRPERAFPFRTSRSRQKGRFRSRK